jgi:hypothetical protein
MIEWSPQLSCGDINMTFLQSFTETEDAGPDLLQTPSAKESAEGLLQTVESMLQGSYTRSESAEDWWSRFSDYYRFLKIDPATRVAFASRLDWLFCQHGETAWPGVRQKLDVAIREIS